MITKYQEGDIVECIANPFNNPNVTVGKFYKVFGVSVIDDVEVYAVKAIDGGSSELVHSIDHFKYIGGDGGVLREVECEDVVNQPKHYKQGKYETIDILEDSLTEDGFEGFLVGNVLKYVLRYRHKNQLEDLKKAKWYLKRVIEKLENKLKKSVDKL